MHDTKNINWAHFCHLLIALYQINNLALVMSKICKYYKSFGKNIKVLDTFELAFTFKFQLYLFRKQSICMETKPLDFCIHWDFPLL